MALPTKPTRRDNVWMPFFDGASGSVHHKRWPVENPQLGLIFLHGRGQHSGHYHRAMGASGIEVWALDQVGHGLTEGDLAVPAPIDLLRADAVHLTGLAESERPGLAFAVMGHSMGAVVAISAVADDRDRFGASVLCGTPKSVKTRGLPLPAVPTLMIHGADDRVAPVDAVQDWVGEDRSVDLRVFENSGHNLLHEPGYATVTEVVAQFLSATMGNR